MDTLLILAVYAGLLTGIVWATPKFIGWVAGKTVNSYKKARGQ